MPGILLSPAATLLATPAGLCVRSDLGTFQLGGADAAAFVEQVAPLCDGTRDRAAIVAALSGYSASSVTALLDAFAARGLIIEGAEATASGQPARIEQRGQEAFFRAWPQAPAGATARLAEARVLVAGHAAWGATTAVELTAAGVGTVQRGDEEAALSAERSPPWTLLVGDRAPADAARGTHLARLAHRAGLVSLWAHLDASHAFLGPLVTPGQTACLGCASVPAFSPQPSALSPASSPRLTIAARLLGHHAALVALQILSGYAPLALGGRLLVQDIRTLASARHTLVRLPWCPVCGK